MILVTRYDFDKNVPKIACRYRTISRFLTAFNMHVSQVLLKMKNKNRGALFNTPCEKIRSTFKHSLQPLAKTQYPYSNCEVT